MGQSPSFHFRRPTASQTTSQWDQMAISGSPNEGQPDWAHDAAGGHYRDPDIDKECLIEIPISTRNAFPTGITAGPDGALWFTERNGNAIVRLDPARSGSIRLDPARSGACEVRAT